MRYPSTAIVSSDRLGTSSHRPLSAVDTSSGRSIVTFMVTPILAQMRCRRWSAKVGSDRVLIATRLLPESQKPQNHSEIIVRPLGSGPRGRCFKCHSPRPTFMIAEKTALPVALPFWGGFRRILAITGGRNANEFAVSGVFGGACLGLQNLHPRFKSGRRRQNH